jgi:hypothetical protein
MAMRTGRHNGRIRRRKRQPADDFETDFSATLPDQALIARA